MAQPAGFALPAIDFTGRRIFYHMVKVMASYEAIKAEEL